MTEPGAKAWLDGERTGFTWLSADDIAEVVAFAAGLPQHVTLQRVTVLPTEQA